MAADAVVEKAVERMPEPSKEIAVRPRKIPTQKRPPEGQCCNVSCGEDAALSLSAVVPLRNGNYGVGTAFVCPNHAYSAAADIVDLAIDTHYNGYEAIERRKDPEDED